MIRRVLFLAVCLFVASVTAGVPSLMNFQGYLTDPDTGEPLTGTYSMTFSIYSASSGSGASLWSETQNVEVLDGAFIVLLGSTNPLTTDLFSASERYLGIAIGSDDEMTPRKRLASVPYSMVSEKTEGVDWSDIDNVPAGFADGVDDSGGTAADDAGREGVVETLYEGETALADRYLRMFHQYVSTRSDPAIDLDCTGPALDINTYSGGAVKIKDVSNTTGAFPFLKMWTGTEPDGTRFMAQLCGSFQYGDGGLLDMKIGEGGHGYCIKGETNEGTGIYCVSHGGTGIFGKSTFGSGYITWEPGIGVKGEGRGYGGFFTATSYDQGVGAYFEGTRLAAEFKGDVLVNGDVTKAYTEGTSSQAVPVAYGNISASGTVLRGTPNVSVSYSDGTKVYQITIQDETYHYQHYITTVTVAGSNPCFAITGSGSGKLQVRIYNISGEIMASNFHFVTYKP